MKFMLFDMPHSTGQVAVNPLWITSIKQRFNEPPSCTVNMMDGDNFEANGTVVEICEKIEQMLDLAFRGDEP